LKQELLHVGASAAEVKTLLPLAARLNELSSDDVPQIGLHTARSTKLRLFRTLTVSVASIAACLILVASSQTVMPTSWLYSVQKLSDNVAVAVHPQYRATVMMKRAQQVNYLVATHADSQQVLAVLSDYDHQAGMYKNLPHANYAAFEFCKSNLQQAVKAAPPHERQAIIASLQPLNDI
jgi:hypothetical protein